MKKPSPATRNALAALVILAAALSTASWVGAGAAVILLIRIRPAEAHLTLARFIPTTPASWITGHWPNYSEGPEIPIRNPATN